MSITHILNLYCCNKKIRYTGVSILYLMCEADCCEVLRHIFSFASKAACRLRMRKVRSYEGPKHAVRSPP